MIDAAAGATVIHSVAKGSPELALIAAVIHRALSDATKGDTEAMQWLGSAECSWYLSRLETDGVAAGLLQERLIEAAENQVSENLDPANR